MEIIYLWVQKYHPFKETGFDFSSKFNISEKYDESSKKIEITVKENELFIPDFYGKKFLNISTIVGQNGTGKSRLIKLLKQVQGGSNWFELHKYICIGYSDDIRTFSVDHNLVELEEKRFHQYKGKSTIEIDLIIPDGYREKKVKIPPSQVIYFSSHPQFNYSYSSFTPINVIDISTDYLLSHDFGDKDKTIVENHRFANTKRQFEFISHYKSISSVSTSLPLPEAIDINFTSVETHDNWKYQLNYSAQTIRKYFLGDQDPYEGGCINMEINEIVHNIHIEKDPKKLEQLYLERKRLFILKSSLHHFFTNMNTENHWLNEDIGVTVSDFNGKDVWTAALIFAQNETWTKNKDSKDFYFFLFKLNSFLALNNIKIGNEHEFRNIKSSQFSEILDLLKLQEKYIRTLRNYQVDSNISPVMFINWRNMSSGEKAMLDLFSRLHYSKCIIDRKNKDKESSDLKIKIIYLFLDEADNGFHPEWQRLFINTIVDFLPLIFEDTKIQLILSTHSPFQLSDMIGPNVVSLKKLSIGSVISTDDFKKTKIYSSNIHSLLAHNFFMKNGVTGEYARSKNQKVINWLKSEGIASEEEGSRFKKIIHLISDNVLKKKLLLMYSKKVGKNAEIDRLETLIKELELRINKLKKPNSD